MIGVRSQSSWVVCLCLAYGASLFDVTCMSSSPPFTMHWQITHCFLLSHGDATNGGTNPDVREDAQVPFPLANCVIDSGLCPSKAGQLCHVPLLRESIQYALTAVRAMGGSVNSQLYVYIFSPLTQSLPPHCRTYSKPVQWCSTPDEYSSLGRACLATLLMSITPALPFILSHSCVRNRGLAVTGA